MRIAAPAVASLTAGCAILAGDPATSLGESQDRFNRRINAQYDPALPGKLRTDHEERGRVIDDGAAAREWREVLDLFRPRMARVPFRDEPERCPDPATVLSCSATQGCECRLKAGPMPPQPASAVR